MTTCVLTECDGSIRATLHDAPRAPNTTWSRIRRGGTTTYHRNLRRREAYGALRHGVLEDLSAVTDDLMVTPDASVAEVKIGRHVASPAVAASWNGHDIELSFALVRTDGTTTNIPDGLQLDNEQGYVIIDNAVHFFTEHEMAEIRQQVLGRRDLPLDRRSITYRHFLTLRRSLAAIGLKVISSFNEDEVLEHLHQLRESQSLQIPELLSDDIKLHDYQEEALEWLQFCHSNELGALLALDMGLGKTCTTIALLAHAHHHGTSLVVCPLSIITNWENELKKFAPRMSVWTHHGNRRLLIERDFLSCDVILTTYETLRSDIEILSNMRWNVLVLDEAQRIKNPGSETSLTCRRLNSTCPLALTGTPFENRPLDLWTIMDFLEPGHLGTQNDFQNNYAHKIEAGDEIATDELKSQVSLFMFRKKKEDVLDDLPPLIESDKDLHMSDWEANSYNLILDKALANSKNRLDLSIYVKLMQFCSHPRLLSKSPEAIDPMTCNKYAYLCDLLRKIRDMGDKVIVFSTWIGMLDLMESDLPLRIGLDIFRIDGGVEQSERQDIINRFSNSSGATVLIGNHATMGVGLNITAANHVIHYNGAWNPAVLDQATDRAHRIGQDKTVWAYFLHYIDSIDQVIRNRVEMKRQIGESLIEESIDKMKDEPELLEAVLATRPKPLQPDEPSNSMNFFK